MERVEKIIDIDRPLTAVYEQFIQFEELPRFVPGLTELRRLDATRLRCRGELAGRWSEWETRITAEEADQRLSWKSASGAQSAGTLDFQSLQDGERTQVRLILAWDDRRVPFGVVDALALEALEAIKQFIETRDVPKGAWRGTVDESQHVSR